MTVESYSAWFLRFLSTFSGGVDTSATGDDSHTRWLEVFVESFSDARLADEQAAEAEGATAEASLEVREQGAQPEAESRETLYEPATREQPRYRTIGGEDK
jgi:hypothetical protein